MQSNQRWRPNVTVAAVVEHDGRFLMVEEHTSKGIRINQPAGHLEQGEDLITAVCREVLEETAYQFIPQGLVGIYLAEAAETGATYMRFAFYGETVAHDPARALDDGIIAAHWLTAEEIRADAARHRSPAILRCLDDWLNGQRFDLSILHNCC